MAAASVKSEKPKVLIFKGEEALSMSLANYAVDLSEKFVREGGGLHDRLIGRFPHQDSQIKLPIRTNSSTEVSKLGLRVPIPPGQVYAINDTISAEGAADDYETCLGQLVKTEILEITKNNGFLKDGSQWTCCLSFPWASPVVKESQRLVTFIKDSLKPPSQRMTFTFPVINSSSYIAQVVCSRNKAAAVHDALGTEKTSDPFACCNGFAGRWGTDLVCG
ncbi:hypothetical protein QJS10_CPA03g01893 [Acorus calamus]|uniref:Glucosamine/galactosamine-6-phosphate isomerase domain-containing protein n=1 Tax=Acorus calamus TaxID=4465 RepID=A0AAV9F729_ACOCL|nr:hypothetical protein QJS10_CPA03g01893 [Acorus calamus]